jgi:hypothetical protein
MPMRRITEKLTKVPVALMILFSPRWHKWLLKLISEYHTCANICQIHRYHDSKFYIDLHINVNLFLTCPLPNTDSHASILFIFVSKQNLHHTSGRRSMFPSYEIPDLNNYQQMQERSNLQINLKSYIEMELWSQL